MRTPSSPARSFNGPALGGDLRWALITPGGGVRGSKPFDSAAGGRGAQSERRARSGLRLGGQPAREAPDHEPPHLRVSAIVGARGDRQCGTPVDDDGCIAWEGVQRLVRPEVVGTATVMAVAAAGIGVNLATALLFRGDRHRPRDPSDRAWRGRPARPPGRGHGRLGWPASGTISVGLTGCSTTRRRKPEEP